MTDTADIIRRLSALKLSAKAFAGVMEIIAELQAKDEERRARDRERKRGRGNSTEIPRKTIGNSTGNSTEIPAGSPFPETKVSPIPPSKTQPLSSTAAAAAAASRGATAASLTAHYDAWGRILQALPDPDAIHWYSQNGRVAQWLANGWDVDLDVLPTIARVVEKRKSKAGRPIVRLEYFEGAIADCFASRTAPVPIGTPENTNAKPGQSRKLTGILDSAIAAAEEAERRDAEGRQDPVRLLSNG